MFLQGSPVTQSILQSVITYGKVKFTLSWFLMIVNVVTSTALTALGCGSILSLVQFLLSFLLV